MSAPDTADAAPARHYFADYEVYDGGQRVAWGQVATHVDDKATSADAIVAGLRDDAARQHGVARGAIRLRCVCRL
jgi:hypothetical protein